MGDRVTEWGTELLSEFIRSGFCLQTMKIEDLRWLTNKEKSHRIIHVIQDKTRQTRQDKTNKTRQDKTRQDKTRQDKTRHSNII